MTTINGCQCGTLNNSNCTMAMNAEHRSKFATLHCQWWPLNHFHIYLVLKGRSRTSAPGARDPVWTYFGIVFINLDCIVCTYFKVVENTSEYFLWGFFWNFSSHSWIFHSFGDVTIDGEGLHFLEFFVPIENFSLIGEGLQILTYARRLWPFSSEGSLACHT